MTKLKLDAQWAEGIRDAERPRQGAAREQPGDVAELAARAAPQVLP